MLRFAPSFIRTLTVGPGISPGQLPCKPQALAGYTAGGDFRPALKARFLIVRHSPVRTHVVANQRNRGSYSFQSTVPTQHSQHNYVFM
jgi:hypothetical protein